MRKTLCLAVAMASLSNISSAQTITEIFGSGVNAFSIDFVEIGNPGNVADVTGSPNPAGSVGYLYNIGKYEVSRGMVDKANLAGGLGITMADMTNYGGNGSNKPATGISWYEAAKFVNWLNTSRGFMPAYKFDLNGNFQVWSLGDAGYDAGNPYRNSLTKYFLPSCNEWYKAAYGSPASIWYDYPTGSNTPPTGVSQGSVPNTVVYKQARSSGPADITNSGGLSAWGTMGQGGNAFEWNETAYDGVNDTAGENVEMRGGEWYGGSESYLASSQRYDVPPSADAIYLGFRVAYIPQEVETAYFQAGFNSGRTAGRADVTGSPATYSLYTATQYNANFSTGQQSILFSPNIYNLYTAQQYANNFTAGKDSVLNSPNSNGLYTTSQIQNMAVGDLVLTRQVGGGFVLNYDIEQSTDLQSWTPYQALSLPLTGLPTDKAFVRIKPKQ